MIVRQGMALAGAGLLIGLPASFVMMRLMSTLLFEISPRDPMTFALVTALLVAVALVACYQRSGGRRGPHPEDPALHVLRDDGVDVGSDNETMVSDDYKPGATDFKGTIVKVTVAQL